MITVYTTTFNEELIMQFFIDFYRTRFPGCYIIVYDNCSSDRTVEIAKANGCEIRPFDSHGVSDNLMLLNHKNSCWKDAKTDWVLVCDTDELLDINEQQLIQEENKGITKILSEAWQMVNMHDNLNLYEIKNGWRDPTDPYFCLAYDKDLLFNKKYVDINYTHAGAHRSDSKGIIKNSNPYKMLHYKYINPDVFVAKHQVNRQRFTENEKRMRWGLESLKSDAEQRSEFQMVRNSSKKILPDI